MTEKSKTLSTLGAKKPFADGGPLDEAEAVRAFRSARVRASYLAEDRIDVCYAVKEASRLMAKPDEAALSALRHIVRHLLGHRRLI